MYDLTHNTGWVNVGIDHDTAQFAVESIRRWWERMGQRRFCHITENWRGRPLLSHEVIVNLIANTTTDTGLSIQAELHQNAYPTGIKVNDEEMSGLNICPAKFHGADWNYTVKSR